MNYKIVGIGEVLWDLLPEGRMLGGAPANFAYHARALGADGRIISRVGADELGKEIAERLSKLGIPTGSIEIDSEHPTGTVIVRLTPEGQPTYTICEGVAWDYITADDASMAIVADADAVCFGSLAQRNEASRTAIRQLVAHSPLTAVRVFDVNLRQRFYSREILVDSLRLANVAKLNDEELPIVSAMLGLEGPPREQLAALTQEYDLCLTACTRGAHGSLLYNGSDWCDLPGSPVQVVDTIGAGDSFTAAMTMGLLAGWNIEELGTFASEVAAYVCSFAGATPALPETLRARFQSTVPEITAM